MRDPKLGKIVADALNAGDFIDPTHKRIFGAISEIVGRGDEPTKHVVAGFFTDKELSMMGGMSALDRIERGAPDPKTVLSHIRGVQEQTLRKKLYRGLDRAKEKLNSMGPTSDALKEIGDMSREVAERMNSETGDIEEIFNKWKDEPDLMGTNTGFIELDALTGGMKPGTLWVVAAYLGTGKCHAEGTEILMYDGSLKKVEDIVDGDRVMGTDSSARTVLRTCSGEEEMFKIIPNKTAPFAVNANHILSLKRTGTHGDKIWTNKRGEIVNINLSDYLKSSASFKMKHKLYSCGVAFPVVATSIDPYFLGMWLGDGTKNHSTITTADNEVLTYLCQYAESIGLKTSIKSQKNNKSKKCSIIGEKQENYLVDSMKAYGLKNNKHIPQEFLINSAENRLQLLAGLIDSDGSLGRTKYFEFCNVDERLANQVVFLARSLGFMATIKKRRALTNFGYCTSYRVNIFGEIWKIPTKIPRKQIKQYSRQKDALMQGFSVENIGVGRYYGFELDKDHLYLDANFVAHHNTHWLIKAMNNIQLASKDKCLFFSLEMQNTRVVKRMAWDLTCQYLPEEKIKDFNVKLFSNKRSISDIEYAIMTNNPKVVFVDYAQLVKAPGKSLFEQMEMASKELQRIAQEYCCCMVVATQVSNDYAKEPSSILSAKGGQALAACADVFVELSRPDMQRGVDVPTERNVVVDVTMDLRKNRDGMVKKMSYEFDTARGFIMIPKIVEASVEVVEMDFDSIGTDKKDLTTT